MERDNIIDKIKEKDLIELQEYLIVRQPTIK